MTNTHLKQKASTGVNTLIDRLKNEGVIAGQKKAEDLISNAQKRAEWIIEEAELEAKALIEQSQKEANDIQAAGKDALQLAARDAFLKLRDNLLGSFSQEVMRVVGTQMSDKLFTEKLILALAGTVREKSDMDASKEVVISLPEDIIGVDELRKNPEELKEGNLSHYTASIAANLLRRGVRFDISSNVEAGLLVQLIDESVVIDFTDETVTALLLEHLQPRFRALFQGIVK